jgi:hypothetical protein
MVTPNIPLCDHCRASLSGMQTYRDFFFCEFAYCSPACLEAAHAERLYALRAEEYAVERHASRYWKVVDGNGEVVCITLGKKGAEEVIQRLYRRRPPPFRPATGASACQYSRKTLTGIVGNIPRGKTKRA